MFDKNNRYMTKGISNELPLELQLLLWGYIDDLNNADKKMDYLQVFKLTREVINGRTVQKITHEQEQPPYKKEHILFTDEMVSLKIYVIDDNTHSTMLLASEY